MSKDKSEFQFERIAFFSDAVFAIALTLLALEIHAPVYGPGVKAGQALGEFLHLIPEFIAVLVSFFLVAMYWRRHHQLFGVLAGYDATLITLNFFGLAAVVFLPFSTAFLSKNWLRFWNNPLVLPFVVYSLNNLVCAAANVLLFRHALDPKNGMYQPSATFDAERVKLEVLTPVLVFTATTVVGCFSALAALPCFALFAFEPLFIRSVLGRRPRASTATTTRKD